MNPEQIRLTLAQSLVVGLSGPEAGQAELEMAADRGLGGVILFARNIESPRQVWELTHSLSRAAHEAGRPPLLIMVDQEGGSVARLKEPFIHERGARELGQKLDARGLAEHAAKVGRELIAAGFNWNLAPVLDVHGCPEGIMAGRSLGRDPEQVAELGAAYITGLQQSGCLACAKHFPGLGRTTEDTHTVRPRVDLSREELAAMELIPFRRAAQAGVAGIMVCHAVFEALDSARPASLSPDIIKGLLRNQLEYQGLVLSDDLEMGAVAAEMDPGEAAVQAYLAGCDLMLVCSRPQMALDALDRLVEMAMNGTISMERIEKTKARLDRVKESLSPLPPPYRVLKELLSLSD